MLPSGDSATAEISAAAPFLIPNAPDERHHPKRAPENDEEERSP